MIADGDGVNDADDWPDDFVVNDRTCIVTREATDPKDLISTLR